MHLFSTRERQVALTIEPSGKVMNRKRGAMRAGIAEPVLYEARADVTVPAFASCVSSGFPSPADDYLDRPLDFNDLLIEHPAATFAVRVAGDSMEGVGIFASEIAVVDRAVNPVDGCIALGILDGEFTIMRYPARAGELVLEAANQAYEPIRITEAREFEVWCVVRHSIRML